jgi:hypothetical protein
MPSGNVEGLRLAERLGGEPAALLLPHHGGFRHSSMVVQIENDGAKS